MIYLRPSKCHGCGENILDEADYVNVLNHEYLELFAIKLTKEDHPAFKWKPDKFNDIMEDYGLMHFAYHEHGDFLYSLDYG
jgi:hypothetical protein